MNYGMLIPPQPYQFGYSSNMNHQLPSDFSGQFGNINSNKQYGTAPITNPSPETSQYPLPYGETSPVNSPQNYPTGGLNNQFFPNPPISYEKYDANNNLPQGNINGGNPNQPETYPQTNPNQEIYKTTSIQQLKEEIGNMQQYLRNLNSPSNTKNSKDQEVIPKLEDQINELQG